MDFITELSLDSKYLQSCDIALPRASLEPFLLVICGGSGDLATRKLVPTIYDLHRTGELPSACSIIGVGLPALSDESYRDLMARACERALGANFDKEKWAALSSALSSVDGEFQDPATYTRLRERCLALSPACGKNLIHCLTVPPDLTSAIVSYLKEFHICTEELTSKVVTELPYGRDKASAIALNRVPREAFKHMRGDLTLFERQDGVEAMWDVVDPLVERWEAVPPRDFPNYRAGTWGPAAAEELLARTGRRWLTV